MIRALIIDDEPSAIETLTFLIQRYVPEISELQNTRDPVKGVEILTSYNPDLLFLDVQMPGLSGFDVLKKVNRFNFEVIFTTAFNQYAIEAIRFSALDFLLKPIDADELKASIQRFLEKRASEEERQKRIENLKYNLAAEGADFKLPLRPQRVPSFIRSKKLSGWKAMGIIPDCFLTMISLFWLHGPSKISKRSFKCMDLSGFTGHIWSISSLSTRFCLTVISRWRIRVKSRSAGGGKTL